MGANSGCCANFVGSTDQNNGIGLARETGGSERVHGFERIISDQKDHKIIAVGVAAVRQYVDVTGGDGRERFAKCGGPVTNTNSDLYLFACLGHQFPRA